MKNWIAALKAADAAARWQLVIAALLRDAIED